jgi:hypothetical protein
MVDGGAQCGFGDHHHLSHSVVCCFRNLSGKAVALDLFSGWRGAFMGSEKKPSRTFRKNSIKRKEEKKVLNNPLKNKNSYFT